MTSLHAIIQGVKAHHGTIFAAGDKIHLRAPAPLPPQLMNLIREEKPALLLYLNQVAAGDGFPNEWRDGYARLCRMPRPDAYSGPEWQQLIDDAGYFLDAWASQCSALGWSLVDVFGVALTAPQARHDAKGLVPLLDGKKIVAVTAELAVIETAGGSRQRYFRRTHKPSCAIGPIWSLK